MEISFLIAVKNNLEYTKYFYETTRKLYPDVELIFVSYGSKDDTDNYLFSLLLDDKNVNVFCSAEEKTFSDTYNKALTLATKDYVAYLHNDVVLTPNFYENIKKHLNERSIVSYTTIEPPIFEGHSRPGKIIREFGRNYSDVNISELYDYSKELCSLNKDKTEEGITFFMCMPRLLLLNMGGMDNLFNPMFCEDDDLILRFKLQNLKMFTVLDAICYHFVSKTSRFGNDFKNRTQAIEIASNRNFVRKWGFRNSSINKKLNIGFVVNNITNELLHNIEPWCDNIYVDIPIDQYIENEQKNTKYDMSLRVKNINSPIINDVIIKFDASKLTNTSISAIKMFPEMIIQNNDIGKFKWDIFEIEVKKLATYEHLLINKPL